METTVINKITVTDNVALAALLPPRKMPHLAYTVINTLAENKIRLLMICLLYTSDIIFVIVIPVNELNCCRNVRCQSSKVSNVVVPSCNVVTVEVNFCAVTACNRCV